MDPLTLLREYTTRDALSEITRVNDTIHFSTDYTFPASIETAYQSKHHTRRYTLDTLVHFITNHNLKHTDYMQHARAHRVAPVTLPDRKPLFDYLTGKIDSSDAILPLDFPPPIDLNNNINNNNHNHVDFHFVEEKKKPIELIKERERAVKDREAMLLCRNKDFYNVLVSAVKRDEESKRNESLVRKDSVVAKNRIERKDGGGGGGVGGKMMMKIGEGVPIILVPSASSTLITMYNVKDFLEDGVFVPTDVKMKQMVKEGKPECVTVQKKFSRDRVVAAYEIRDKPSALKSDDWDRVVAVFVLGKEWQFKDWPFKDHVEVFNKILGFYVRFEDDSVESAKMVKQWNVKIISISKNKRHQDRTAALEVWEKLEEFMRSRSR